jgi:hypothetical protein
MSQRLATAVDELRAEETRIRGDLDELRRQVKSSETQLKQIQRALSVLDEKPRNKSANHKPAATKQEVVAAIGDVLNAKGSVEETELKQLVADALSAVGKSRIGLALRFTEALKEDRFLRGEDGHVSQNEIPASP